MALITVETDCEDMSGESSPAPRCADANNGDITLRASNEASENGYDQDPGPLDWLNSARLVLDGAQDRVMCCVSVGDPRGAFAFEVRRTDDGRILLHTPHASDTLPHMRLRELHPGTFEVVTEGAAGVLSTYHHERAEPDDDETDDE